VAVIELAPTGSVVVESVAIPFTSVPVPSVVEPLMNVTVPVADGAPVFCGAMVAVNITFWFTTGETGNTVTVVVVVACETVTATGADVLVL
jgi:hypothetical protein